jgi:4-amino-4-deoxy-L-arabinose transferase-like glycosyltransferase
MNHDRTQALRIVGWALAFRVASALLAFAICIALKPPQHFNVGQRPHAFWDTFARFDSGWYEPIARDGYRYVEGGRSNIAFFPGYPMAMRFAGWVFPHSYERYFFGGILVSWICFALAMAALYYLARLDLPRPRARRAVLLAAIFPFSFFFGAVYSESMFLLFTVLAFYGFRTRRWLLGGLSASIAIVTRVPGILMMPCLAWLAWKHAQPTLRDRGLAAAALVLSLAGFAWYCAFIYSLSGNPFEWIATIERWGYHPGGAPWAAPVGLLDKLLMHPYTYLTSDPNAIYDTLYGVTGLVFLGLTVVVWRRFGLAYGLFMLLSLWLPISSGVFEGVGRYCSVLFPAFIWMATIRSRSAFTALVVLFALFYTLGLTLFLFIKPIF